MEKVIVITGAGGVLCSGFAEFLAGKGNKAVFFLYAGGKPRQL